MATPKQNTDGTFTMSGSKLSTDQWAGLLVLIALALLMLIRRGFRGINVLGAQVRV